MTSVREPPPREPRAFQEFATDKAIELLSDNGIQVRSDGKRELQLFFARGAKTNVEEAADEFYDGLPKLLEAARENNIREITKKTWSKIRPLICPWRPFCD
jgi:hypothetical protein